MNTLRKLCLIFSAIATVVLLAGLGLGRAALWHSAAVIAVVALATGLGAVRALKGYQFTAWILAAVVAAMLYPSAFLQWGDFDLRNKWLILIVVQLVMFGMGTQMSLHDFAGVAKAPRGVLVGIICHFSVMPLVGWTLTKVFNFEPEIAAGIILIGSCSSGLASNVMTYIAKANLPLSVTVTAVTTMVAPIMTPLLMKLLAGTLVEVKFMNLMIEIVKIVLVPIAAALIHDHLKRVTSGQFKVWIIAQIVCGLSALFLFASHDAGWQTARSPAGRLVLELLAFALGAVAVGVTYHQFTRLFPRLDAFMPVVSMAGIVYFTTVTTAAGRDNLLKVGALLFLASALHNAAGYFFGYWLSRGAGLDRNSARSVAFEVGLQNGGMASGLAGAMGKLATVGLAAAIFSPWMNISGSILANYWGRRPKPPEKQSEGD
ncbi:MAG: bile acid:sodium symporter family protein [Opitutaceae bacterium]|nr:bile acid:sodium symporter family protein [Opitutaceae bacterium]